MSISLPFLQSADRSDRVAAEPTSTATAGPSARARAVAQIVNPLITDALALHDQLATAGASRADCAAGRTPVPFAAFAEAWLASAHLMAACVRGVGGATCARRSDVGAPASVRATQAMPGELDAVVRWLLDGEEQAARHLRHAIAACDDQGDDRTADCLEEVLDEVVARQRRVLLSLLGEARA